MRLALISLQQSASATGYENAVDLAAAGLLLSALVIVWRRSPTAMIGALAVQGGVLALIPLTHWLRDGELADLLVAAVVLAVRAVLVPLLLIRAIHSRQVRSPDEDGSGAPLVNTAASLLAAALLTVVAFAISSPIVRLQSGPAGRLVPVGIALVLVALFLMITRRRALSQIVGFLMLDNGISAVAFLLAAGVPITVELGASLDLIFVSAVVATLSSNVRAVFGNTDVTELRELHE